MIVDFDNDPRNSIIYTSGIILSYLKCQSNSKNFHDLFGYCLSRKMEYSIFFLSLDWMFLVGIIKEINERNEVVLCD